MKERVFLDLHLEGMGSLRDPQNFERQRGLQDGGLGHPDLARKHLQLTSGSLLLTAQWLINLKKTIHLSKVHPSSLVLHHLLENKWISAQIHHVTRGV